MIAPSRCGLVAALIVLAPAALSLPQAEGPEAAYTALSARAIGPAGMSGRVAAIDAIESAPNTFFVGAATGGLWKTTDGGLTFEPLFDSQPVASIGAIAVYQASPEIVWVGTGEGNPRNSSSVGNGVYRSLDGGATWAHLGLEQTEKISRIVVHPGDPDTAWVAALGTTWGENEQRGVFRTTDGGATWDQVLYVDERTGCADLVIDPRNPRKLFAAMWQHRRYPHFFDSGGPGSGVHVTRDGGATWERVTSGMPSGDLGRVGLGICRSQPDVVYALVEAEKSALLRSDDGGRNFRTVNAESGVSPRPFYYGDIRVDPLDPERVYRLASVTSVSHDGGRTFETLIPWGLIHPDHHALWINPNDPQHLIDGNDGGIAISRDRGGSWRFGRNLPLAQYYHIAVDMDVPYHVYGGMQDNGSWRGPSSVWENGGIRNHHWDEVGFGDGFDTRPMPDDSSRGYAMSQGGALFRWNNVTGERKGIQPDPPLAPAADGAVPEPVELRFNWNAGLALDPHDSNTIYYGSQFVHRSRDRGDTWEVISPDLTTNNPAWQRQAESGGLTPDVTAAENYTSILTIAPSPLDPNTIWAGTDDGRVHVTRDAGVTGTSVEEHIHDVPRNTWCAHIEASKHDAATAYAVFDDHRRANWTTYVMQTTDYGATWKNLATDAIRGYAHVLEEDPVDPNLLFVGTEFGLWVSQDGGASWWQWTHGVPTVSVRDLVVHPREHDLVIGTHGRAGFIIDGIQPLRAAEATPDGAPANGLRLLDPAPAYQHRTKQTAESRFPGSNEFRGANAPFGARFDVFVDESLVESAVADDNGGDDGDGENEKESTPRATVDIVDAEGRVLRSMRMDVKAGLNRLRWNLRETGARGPGSDAPSGDLPGGPAALPGTYTVRVAFGEASVESSFEVLADPRVDVDLAAWAAKNALIREAGRLSEVYGALLERLEETQADVRDLTARADRDKDPDAAEDADHPHKGFVDAGKVLTEALDAFEKTLRQTADEKGIQRDRIGNDVMGPGWQLGSSWDAPTPTNRAAVEKARARLGEALEGWSAIEAEELAAFRAALVASGIVLLPEREPLALPAGGG